ncbi:hypothetical protein HJFPF1_13490 [Paramyrothecium foliicola]|nr:hypothetical protein HJFPF1_13490 [Paramyrothecium foliicola]
MEDEEYSPLTADEASDVTAESDTPVRGRGGKRPGSGRPRKRLRSAVNPASPKTTLEASIKASEKDCASHRFTVTNFSDPPGTERERKLVQAGNTYVVEPSKAWLAMQGYESFDINDIKFNLGDFVYVTNVANAKNWVAHILEVRAESDENVYARVTWMYSPDDLPKGTKDGMKEIEGRQPYHGTDEYIQTNHGKPLSP